MYKIKKRILYINILKFVLNLWNDVNNVILIQTINFFVIFKLWRMNNDLLNSKHKFIKKNKNLKIWL